MAVCRFIGRYRSALWLVGCAIAVFCASASHAEIQESSLRLVSEGQYFSVHGYTDLDINALLARLDFNYSSRAGELGKSSEGDLQGILAKTIDALFLEASDILDIHVYSFHGDIKIVPTRDDVNAIFKRFFGTGIPERSFYFVDNNTIYISFDDITLGMLGHEIARAIVSRYFVVPPPAKIQEVLCGYVEYHLSKKSGTLP